MAAQPRDSNACANTIVCSLSQPPFTQSVPDTHFEGKAHALLQTATTLIVASVGERRKELVQQIAVRAVELNAIYAEPRGGLGCRDEALTHPPEAVSCQLGMRNDSVRTTTSGAELLRPVRPSFSRELPEAMRQRDH